MDCKKKGCSGEVDLGRSVMLKVGCSGCGGQYTTAHACKICGRVHWPDGSLVYDRAGNEPFLEGKRIVNRNEKSFLKRRV